MGNWINRISEQIRAAKGEFPVDFLLEGANLVNVLSGEIYPTQVAIFKDRVVGFGAYEARERINVQDKFICPGFIDGHLHLESTLLTPWEFVRAVTPLGTSSVVLDPHEITNVLGVEGLKYLHEVSRNLPLSFYFTLPSCVPTTPLETSGATLEAEELKKFMKEPWVLGLGEMMNFPGVIAADPEILKKLEITGNKCKDGHAPLLRGKNLFAYLATGIASDHECTQLEEALEKMRSGMYIMIREGSTSKNLIDLLPLVTPKNNRRCMIVSDDKSPVDLVNSGHLNNALKKIVAKGCDPVLAIQMVTINPAEYFGLRQMGAVAPGYLADLVVLDDLRDFQVHLVFHRGRKVAQCGSLDTHVVEELKIQKNKSLLLRSVVRNSVHLKPLNKSHLEIPAQSGKKARIIQIIPNQIKTKCLIKKIKVVEEKAVSDPSRDILKLVVVERHKGTGRVGLGFVKGMGLKDGALASSVAHDSHNIIAVGVEDEDLLLAIREIGKLQGGWIISNRGKVIETLPLPIAGLLSAWSLKKTVKALTALNQRAFELGCTLDEPFSTLSFLALPVIPELKLTDLGLVDVSLFQHVSLFVGD